MGILACVFSVGVKFYTRCEIMKLMFLVVVYLTLKYSNVYYKFGNFFPSKFVLSATYFQVSYPSCNRVSMCLYVRYL